MTNWSVICADVLEWCGNYTGEPFHAILCDPPYALNFMNKAWDNNIAFQPETWAALAEHLLPGGFIMAFASSRGWHRLVCAMEDAGLIIQPSIFGWLNSQAFPKATRIDTAIDKAAGKLGERAKIPNPLATKQTASVGTPCYSDYAHHTELSIAATDLARAWEGHRYGGQILKNCLEPIICAMKPLTIWQKNGILVEEITSLMEVFLCQFINVKAAEGILKEARERPSEASESSVPLSAFLMNVLSLGTESEKMDMFKSREVGLTSSNIVSLWNSILGDLWNLGSSYITSMEIQVITILKTWKSWLLANIPNTIIQAAFPQNGQPASVLVAEENLSTTSLKEKEEHSVLGNAISSIARREDAPFASNVEKNSIPQVNSKESQDFTALLGAIAEAERSKAELTQLAKCAESLLESLLGQLRTSSITNVKSAHGENKLTPIIVAQKPWEGKRLDCIVETGAGALWVDGGRIGTNDGNPAWDYPRGAGGHRFKFDPAPNTDGPKTAPKGGRWPANFALCHSEGCERAKSKSDNFPYSFKDSVRIPIIYDSVNSDTLPKKLFVNFSVTWLSSCSVMVGGIIYFNDGIEMGEIEINNEAPLLSNSDPLMLKLDSFFTQLIGDFKLNFWDGKGFPTDKTFTAMNGKFEAISLSASDLTNIGTEDFSLSSFDSPRMGFKFFAADRTDAGDFVSSVSNLEFIRTFLATRFPGGFDRKSFFDDCNELRFADGADSFDFAHWTPPGGIIQQQSSTVKVDAWECVEGCPAARLDEQAGERKSGVAIQRHGGGQRIGGQGIYQGSNGLIRSDIGYSDSGGPSRFYYNADWSHEVAERIVEADPVRYQPKAAKRERNQNLDNFYWLIDKRAPIGFIRIDKAKWEDFGREEERIYEKTGKRVRLRAKGNIHPTAKPISLNKWLATLLLPPSEYAPRRILIPFFGSGSEGIGAGLAGWEEIIGIDSEQDYCDIATARLSHWLNQFTQLELV